MTNRINKKDLETLTKHINTMTNSPATTYTRNSEGQLRGNIGNYYLNWAYGGVQLVRMGNPEGGINVVSLGGYGTKRELYNWLQAFIRGLDTAKAA